DDQHYRLLPRPQLYSRRIFLRDRGPLQLGRPGRHNGARSRRRFELCTKEYSASSGSAWDESSRPMLRRRPDADTTSELLARRPDTDTTSELLARRPDGGHYPCRFLVLDRIRKPRRTTAPWSS